ncbi:hypothetical protein FLK61_28340 [Paenalkalicoccus suaedae]|uniref:Uncharacterized protein n=1 Tax=Paenalkalicoccus suaedae TaxID=2592382 RepID=A0A859FDK2_9BACI|nr:hypothetical protein [Paenalkalicoccus suaedae]QKS70654.1 hypothetical protein FLK61_28340 [Paenalkalicoccus suaedae]
MKSRRKKRKKSRLIVIPLAILVVLGVGVYAGYQLLMNVASDTVFQEVEAELAPGGALAYALENPTVREEVARLQAQAANTPREDLPVQSKAEATQLVMSKFSMGEITEVVQQASRGMTESERKEVEQKLMDRLTEEEREALLMIGIQELDPSLFE